MQRRIPAACASSAIARAFALNCSTSAGVSASPVNVLSTRTSSALPAARTFRRRRIPSSRWSDACPLSDTHRCPNRSRSLCVSSISVGHSVGIEVLEESLDGTDLDVLESCLAQPAQRLLERVRLEADGRPGLDPAHVALPSFGSSRPHMSRWNSTNPSGKSQVSITQTSTAGRPSRSAAPARARASSSSCGASIRSACAPLAAATATRSGCTSKSTAR